MKLAYLPEFFSGKAPHVSDPSPLPVLAEIMPGRAPRRQEGKTAAMTPGHASKHDMKHMSMSARHARLAVQKAGAQKISKGQHLLSADTRYRRVGNHKIGGMSKKKIKQRATRAKNIQKSGNEAGSTMMQD